MCFSLVKNKSRFEVPYLQNKMISIKYKQKTKQVMISSSEKKNKQKLKSKMKWNKKTRNNMHQISKIEYKRSQVTAITTGTTSKSWCFEIISTTWKSNAFAIYFVFDMYIYVLYIEAREKEREPTDFFFFSLLGKK